MQEKWKREYVSVNNQEISKIKDKRHEKVKKAVYNINKRITES